MKVFLPRPLLVVDVVSDGVCADLFNLGGATGFLPNINNTSVIL